MDIFDDANDALDYFLTLFTDTLDIHAPLKQKRVKYIHQPDWFNKEIEDAIKSRNCAKKMQNSDDYKYWRQKVNFFLYKIKKKKKNNPKLLWKHLKSLSNKTENHQTNYINDEQGDPITDSLLTAKTFNDFFLEFLKLHQ